MFRKFIGFRILVAVAAILVSGLAFSQSSTTSQTVDLFERIPSSPNSGSLKKYTQFPVNLASGAASVNIPLYTIKAGGITIPISLSCNTTGIKVSELSSWVGTGWTLNAVGAINKKVNGHDDIYGHVANSIEKPGPYYSYNSSYYGNYIDSFNTLSDFIDSIIISGTAILSQPLEIQSFLGRIPHNQVDGEADEYFFSTPGGGGKFFYHQGTQTYVTDKPDGWKVLMNEDTTFSIYNRAGIKFDYGLKERTANPLFGTVGGPSLKWLLNTYHPTQIQDEANETTVSITYENFYSNVMIGRSMWADYQMLGGITSTFGSATNEIYREGDEYTITSINFPGGKVLFVKDTAVRLDIGPKPLKYIEIYNERNVLTRRVVFDYFYMDTEINTYCGSPNKRLFLKSVSEIDYAPDGTTYLSAPYEFTYYDNYKLPCIYSMAQDYWGYYNGKVTNTTLIPDLPWYSVAGIPAQANRQVDTVYTQSGTIKSIKYPTGGAAIFEYENNRTDTLVGGIRIKRLKYVDSLVNKAIVTEYEYKTSTGLSSGITLYSPVFYYEYLYVNSGGDARITRLESDAIYPLFPNQGSPVLYSTVLEKQISDSGELRVRHFYSNFWAYTNDSYQNMSIGVPHNKYELRADLVGKEFRTEYYKRNSNGTYSVTRVDSLEYQPVTDGRKYAWNVQGSWTTVMGDWIVWPGNDPYTTVPLNTNPSINAYKLVQQNLLTAESFSSIYENGELLRQSDWNNYDSVTSSIRESRSVNSIGDTLITFVKYANNYISTGTWPSVNHEIKMLQEKNILAAPIEIVNAIKKKNTSVPIVTSATVFEYKDLNVFKVYKVHGAVPLDEFMFSYNNPTNFYKDSRYVLEQEVLSTDARRRPLTVVGRQKKMTYLWNDVFEEPAAVISNADIADVAQSSFELFENGGWTISSTHRDSSVAVTGRRSYILSNGNISKTGLNSSKEYLVSAWVKTGSGTFNINSGAGDILMTKNGWNLVLRKVTSSTTVTVSGTARIDELRLVPGESEMTSFQYDRVLGVKDICDSRGQVIRYVYKGPGMLAHILDQDDNVVKKFEYRYGDHSGGAGLYYSAAVSDSFYRNNCGAGYVGGAVLYTMAAGAYSSTVSQAVADSLATAALAANGQSYANANGSCEAAVYAKLTYENFNYSISNAVHADVVVRFYSDAACTVPLSVSSLTILLSTEGFDGSDTFSYDYPETVSGYSFMVEASAELLFEGYTYRFKDYYLSAGSGYTVVW